MSLENSVSNSVGSQAGVFETRNIASCILELLKKCYDIRDLYDVLNEELRNGREHLTEQEQTAENVQTTVEAFSETMDTLGVGMLQGNIATSQRDTLIDDLKRDIATLTKYLENGEHPQQTTIQPTQERLNDIKTHRGKMEMQLVKMKINIDNTYEDLFETQEKLVALKDLRDVRRKAGAVEIAALKDKTAPIMDRKRNILTVTDRDSIDMSEMYVSPTAFVKLEADIESLKRQQQQMDRHIQMQLDERAFLRDTANSIIQRVFELEKKVRKETGDHGWESALSVEPKWHQEFSTPSVWHSLPPMTTDQLKRMQELYFRYFTSARAVCYQNENEATSDEKSDEIIVIDIGEASV